MRQSTRRNQPSLLARMSATGSAAILVGNFVIATAAAANYNVDVCRIARLKPGIIVEDRAPQGWSHLILKNQPRLEGREAEKVHPIAARLAGALFSVFVAHVDQDPRDPQHRFRLHSYAAGLGTRIAGRDVIISSQTLDQQSDQFGFIDNIVVSRTEKELDQWLQIARSPSMLIFDTPCWMVRQGGHQRVTFRHAVLVNPRDGGLVTLAWLLTPIDRRRRQLTADPMRWLLPNLVYEYPLHIDETQVTAGIPTSTAFAMHDLPPGYEVQFPSALRPIAAHDRLTPAMAQKYEAELWQVVQSVSQRRPPTADLRPRPSEGLPPPKSAVSSAPR